MSKAHAEREVFKNLNRAGCKIAMNELKQFDYNEDFFAPALTGRRAMQGSRYVKPPKCKDVPERLLKYRNAEQLAKDLKPEKGMRVFVILDGSFIAGDFIEAFCVEHNLHVKQMTISTLSLSQNNVDSLKNLLGGGYVDELNLIVSDYFFSHERHGLIPYMYELLDKENKFQLAVAGTHCKLILFETHAGSKVTIHGSANLRSSGNLEHICIEENETLFDFNQEIQSSIIEKYKTINKAIRHETLWQQVQK